MQPQLREPLLQPYGQPQYLRTPPGSYAHPPPLLTPPSRHVAVPLPAADVPRWRGGLLACCGYCSGTDLCATCCACCFPCFAFARNMQRSLSLSFVAQLCLYFLLVYVARSTAISLVVACAADDSALPDCTVATASVNVAYWSLMSCFALYAGYRRFQIRQRFGIAGTECGDYAAWLCCPTLALCQETRTLAANNVEDGVWVGAAAQASPMLMARSSVGGYPAAGGYTPAPLHAFGQPAGGGLYSPAPSAPPPFAPLPAEQGLGAGGGGSGHGLHLRPGIAVTESNAAGAGSFYIPRKQ